MARLSPSRFVELIATNPAELYGLYPGEDTITIGSDAALIIWNPDAQVTIRKKYLHYAVDYTLYEGRTLRGKPEIVTSRSDGNAGNGAALLALGRGKFLAVRSARPVIAKNDSCHEFSV